MDVSSWMRLACYLLCLCNPFPPAPERPSNIIITNYTSSLTVQWDEERDAKYIIYVQKNLPWRPLYLKMLQHPTI